MSVGGVSNYRTRLRHRGLNNSVFSFYKGCTEWWFMQDNTIVACFELWPGGKTFSELQRSLQVPAQFSVPPSSYHIITLHASYLNAAPCCCFFFFFFINIFVAVHECNFLGGRVGNKPDWNLSLSFNSHADSLSVDPIKIYGVYNKKKNRPLSPPLLLIPAFEHALRVSKCVQLIAALCHLILSFIILMSGVKQRYN